MGYYITDENGYRMRDSKDELFVEPDMEAVENTIYYYFDAGYADCYRVYDEFTGELVDTFIKETYED